LDQVVRISIGMGDMYVSSGWLAKLNTSAWCFVSDEKVHAVVRSGTQRGTPTLHKYVVVNQKTLIVPVMTVKIKGRFL